MPPVTAASLEQAFAAHHAGAVRLAYLLCGDHEQAEDAVATVWLKVHRRLERGPVDDIGAYVRRAVVNEVNSWFRKLGVRRREAARVRRVRRARDAVAVEAVVGRELRRHAVAVEAVVGRELRRHANPEASRISPSS